MNFSYDIMYNMFLWGMQLCLATRFANISLKQKKYWKHNIAIPCFIFNDVGNSRKNYLFKEWIQYFISFMRYKMV